MTCPRCTGLVVVEALPQFFEVVEQERCLCCGFVRDAVMAKNLGYVPEYSRLGGGRKKQALLSLGHMPLACRRSKGVG